MEEHDRTPRQLGPYRILERIGHGGTSQVFRAEVYGASGFSKTVAIKTLLPSFLGDPEYERLFIREARLGARLVHQNIVGVHDFGVQDGVQYMRLDYVEGVDLRAYMDERRLSVSQALFVASEIAEALRYLHGCGDEEGRSLGLVYRDLKPSNVLISRCGEVRLTDFGILKATAKAEVTRGSVRRGTYLYMSPEQVRGAALTAASDQFSLGALLVEAVLGASPFEADNVPEVLDRIRAATPAGLDALDAALAPVVGRMLALEPRERFETSDALCLELQRLRREYPVAARL